MNSELTQAEKRAKDKQQRINHDGQKLKGHLNEQQRRLENAKSELVKVISGLNPVIPAYAKLI